VEVSGVYRDRTVGVVVPAYNEEGKVSRVVETMPPTVDRIYIVDDASTDDTWSEITDAVAAVRAREDGEVTAAFDQRWVPIQHEENTGVGGAILTGYQRALEDGVDATAVMAGDAQMDPNVLPRLLDPIVEEEAEYVKASRLLRREDWKGMPPFRLFGNLLLTGLTRISSGYWRMTDPQNGYTVISERALREVDLDTLYEDYGFANDLLVRLNAAGLPIADVETPSEFFYDDEEWDSHIDLKTFVPRTSMLLLRNFLWRLRRDGGAARVFLALYAVGVVGVTLAVGTLLSGVVEAGPGDPLDGTGSGAGELLLAGIVALLLGLAVDVGSNAGLLTRVYAGDD
jgi:glycosyltransferase involved in cell wall biosynthesis